MAGKSRSRKSRRLNARERQEDKDLFQEWHWGIAPTTYVKFDDVDYPRRLIECGRFSEFVFDAVPSLQGAAFGQKTVPRSLEPALKKRLTRLVINENMRHKLHLAFDREHPKQRLYIASLSKEVNRTLRALWTHNTAKPRPLSALAKKAPGAHATPDCPKVMVKPVGRLYEVVYVTAKEGDGPSHYFHHLGENNGKRPLLAVDARGRLWFAGGDYEAKIPGIDN
jgi:hypothetical protein